MDKSKTLFRRVRKDRVSDKVVEQILELIEEGRLKVGDQLPGERDLIDQLHVARASIREALRILEFQGIIEVQPGRGAFVTSEVINETETDDGVRRWFREHSSEVLEILEVREALEARSARLAAKNASEQDIEDLRDIQQRAYECIEQNDFNTLIHLDREFHRLISKASGNQMLSQLIDMTIDAMVSPRRSIMRLPGRAPQSWTDHQAVLDAIANGNPEQAEKNLLNHINSVRHAVVELTEERKEEEPVR